MVLTAHSSNNGRFSRLYICTYVLRHDNKCHFYQFFLYQDWHIRECDFNQWRHVNQSDLVFKAFLFLTTLIILAYLLTGKDSGDFWRRWLRRRLYSYLLFTEIFHAALIRDNNPQKASDVDGNDDEEKYGALLLHRQLNSPHYEVQNCLCVFDEGRVDQWNSWNK